MPTYTGIDLSASERNTGVCRLTVTPQGVEIDVLRQRFNDEHVCQIIIDSDLTAIDVPLGWPEAFSDAIHAHRNRRWAPTARERWHDLRYRLTDQAAHDRLGWNVLTASADKLGVTAMRMADIEMKLATAYGIRVDRSGMSGRVLETYPAGAVRMWTDSGRPTKKSAPDMFLPLVDEIDATWTGDSRHHLMNSDHAFDALVAAFVAWARDTGATHPPVAAQERRAAATEGWLHLPKAGSWPLTLAPASNDAAADGAASLKTHQFPRDPATFLAASQMQDAVDAVTDYYQSFYSIVHWAAVRPTRRNQ